MMEKTTALRNNPLDLKSIVAITRHQKPTTSAYFRPRTSDHIMIFLIYKMFSQNTISVWLQEVYE